MGEETKKQYSSDLDQWCDETDAYLKRDKEIIQINNIAEMLNVQFNMMKNCLRSD